MSPLQLRSRQFCKVANDLDCLYAIHMLPCSSLVSLSFSSLHMIIAILLVNVFICSYILICFRVDDLYPPDVLISHIFLACSIYHAYVPPSGLLRISSTMLSYHSPLHSHNRPTPPFTYNSRHEFSDSTMFVSFCSPVPHHHVHIEVINANVCFTLRTIPFSNLCALISSAPVSSKC